MGEYLESSLLPRLDFDIWQIQECFTKHISPHFPPPPLSYSLTPYICAPYLGGWLSEVGGETQFWQIWLNLLKGSLAAEFNPWNIGLLPRDGRWDMGMGLGGGLIWISPFGDIRCGTWYFWWNVPIKQMCKWPKIGLIDSFFWHTYQLASTGPEITNIHLIFSFLLMKEISRSGKMTSVLLHVQHLRVTKVES